MNDFREVEESRLSEFEQLLTLQIALASLAGYRRHHGRAMRGERGAFVGNEFPRMFDFISARHDAYAIGIQVQRRRHANGLGRHRVGMTIVQNGARRAYIDRNAKCEIFRVHLQGTKSGGFFGKTHGGDDARRTAGTLLIHFAVPFDQLLLEIRSVVKAPHFEKGRFYEAYQVLDSSFLLRLLRPTQLHPNAHLQHGVSEDRIPFRDFAVPPPLQSHRLRSIEDAHQRNSTPTVEMLGQVAHQALYRLVLHHTDANQSGVLQTRSEEVDATGRPVEKGNLYFSEIMLAKFSGQTFETNQRFYLFRTNRSHQSVQGGLASLVACFANSAKDLQRG